jgi:hypothetical protein
MSNIPKGYQLHITSWTNDADNYNTTIHSGLSPDDVNFLLQIVKPFKSRHSGGKFGNNEGCTMAINEHIFECWQGHNSKEHSAYADWFDDRNEEDEDYAEGLSDLAYDLVGCDEYCGWRVFDGAKVFHFPVEVKEVTETFS